MAVVAISSAAKIGTPKGKHYNSFADSDQNESQFKVYLLTIQSPSEICSHLLGCHQEFMLDNARHKTHSPAKLLLDPHAKHFHDSLPIREEKSDWFSAFFRRLCGL